MARSIILTDEEREDIYIGCQWWINHLLNLEKEDHMDCRTDKIQNLKLLQDKLLR